MTSILDDINRAARRAPAPRGGVELVGGTFVDKHDDFHARVDVLGEEIVLPALLGQYRRGGAVNVQRDGTSGKATLVYGPADGADETDGREIVVVGGKLAETLDPETREKANRALEQLAVFFTHSDRDPLPEDGAGKPEGAYWIRLDEEGEDAARWRWDGTAWVESTLGPELIVREAVIWALVANEIFTKNLVLSDEVDGYVNVTDARGVQIFAPDGSEMIRLRVDGPTLFGIAKSGAYVAMIDEDGAASFNSVSSTGDVTFDGGRSLVNELGTVGGRTYGKAQLSNAVTIDVNPKGILGVTFKLPGRGARQLKVTVQAQASVTPAPRSVALPLYFAEGETVTTGNTVRFPYNGVTSTQNRTQHGYTYSLNTAELGVGDAAVLSVMFGAQSDSGGTWDMHSGAQTSLVVEDAGPAVPTARTVIQTSDPTKPTQNSVTPRQDVFLAQAFRTYDGDGTPRPEVPNLYQGYTAYYPAGGRRRSAVQFPDLSGLLAGADVEWVEIDIHSLFWHANAGGTISVGVKDGLLPASLPDAAIGAHSLAQTHMGRGQTKTIRLPSAVHAGIKSGATRLITFFTTSTSSQYYGYFSPSSFKIRVRYQK